MKEKKELNQKYEKKKSKILFEVGKSGYANNNNVDIYSSKLKRGTRNTRIFAILGHGSLKPSIYTGEYGDVGRSGIKSLKRITFLDILNPFIIILSNKFNYNNKKLIKFIYKYYNKIIIIYTYIDINKSSNDIINIYKNEFVKY